MPLTFYMALETAGSKRVRRALSAAMILELSCKPSSRSSMLTSIHC